MAKTVRDPAGRIEDQLDRVEPRMRRAFMEAVAAARLSNGSLEQLADMLEQGRFEEALDEANRVMVASLQGQFQQAYIGAGESTAAFLSEGLGTTVSFDVVNERAVAQMRAERLRLISGFTSEQRRATRDALTEGIARGLNPRDQARTFRASIGLTQSQVNAVQNYRTLLQSGTTEALSRDLRDKRFDRTVRRAARDGVPLTQAQIDRMTTRYDQNYVRFRSETIARTEALRAVNSATNEAYEQAIDEGTIEKDELERTWVTARDSRVRDSHRDLQGQTKGIDETFQGDDGELRFPGDPLAPASETVNCRCVLAHRINQEE